MPPVDLIKATDDRDCVSLDSASHSVSFSLEISCCRFDIVVVIIDYSKFLVKYVVLLKTTPNGKDGLCSPPRRKVKSTDMSFESLLKIFSSL